MAREQITVSDIAERLGVSSAGRRALERAAQHGALGVEVWTYARARYWFADDVLPRAALFLTLHRRMGIPATTAIDLVRAADAVLAGPAPGGPFNLRDAMQGVIGRGERWAFEVQYLNRSDEPVVEFRPWGAPRLGTEEGHEPPVGRLTVDLWQCWGWLQPASEESES